MEGVRPQVPLTGVIRPSDQVSQRVPLTEAVCPGGWDGPCWRERYLGLAALCRAAHPRGQRACVGVAHHGHEPYQGEPTPVLVPEV